MRLREQRHSCASLLVALFSALLFICLPLSARGSAVSTDVDTRRAEQTTAPATAPATAQTIPPVKVEIVVTPERGPVQRNEVAASVTVLTRAQIEALPAQSLDEVIGFIPGVTMYFDNLAGGAPMISARGFFGGGEVEYVKLLVDGVPAGDVESGLIDWRHLRVADIERIEVLRGPGSSLYGDTAMGRYDPCRYDPCRYDPQSRTSYGPEEPP